MSMHDDLYSAVKKIFSDSWTTRIGQVVPESINVELGNDAVSIEGTVLYADLAASTALVDGNRADFAAEIYKAYLFCAAKIIRSENGAITAYDGDRIMAVFIGDRKNTRATRAGLMINWAVQHIINPLLESQYPQYNYRVRQTVGIDSSNLFVARTGIRGANDLVWVGRAANHAAKLCALSADYPTRISASVYSALDASLKTSNGEAVWEQATWKAMNDLPIYRSTWFLAGS